MCTCCTGNICPIWLSRSRIYNPHEMSCCALVAQAETNEQICACWTGWNINKSNIACQDWVSQPIWNELIYTCCTWLSILGTWVAQDGALCVKCDTLSYHQCECWMLIGWELPNTECILLLENRNCICLWIFSVSCSFDIKCWDFLGKPSLSLTSIIYSAVIVCCHL